MEEGLPALAFGFDFQESAFDAVEAVVIFVFAGGAGGMGVAGGADGELVGAGFGVDGVVLPVAVAVDVDEVIAEGRFGPVGEVTAVPQRGVASG